MTNNLVINNNGVATTTSLKVAEVFNKQHYDVLKRINTLKKELNSSDFDTDGNFAVSEYNDITGRKLPCYNLTRDGFTLLAMGFTGKKALEFKLKYIKAFNMMEETLKKIHNRPLNLEYISYEDQVDVCKNNIEVYSMKEDIIDTITSPIKDYKLQYASCLRKFIETYARSCIELGRVLGINTYKEWIEKQLKSR